MRIRPKILLTAMGLWLLLLVLAILNGAARDLFITPQQGEAAARAVSSLTLIGIILAVTWVFLARSQTGYSLIELFTIGTVWVLASIAFEFAFGRLALKKSWASLLQDYNLFQGRLLVLVWLAELFAPAALGALLRKKPKVKTEG